MGVVTQLVEIILIIAVVIILIPLTILAARRRWISRQGGIFDCSLRRSDGDWIRGLARYRGENLQWFPAFSIFFKPSFTFHRAGTKAISKRIATQSETHVLYGDERIVQLTVNSESCELSMAPEVMTAFLSWLEAAPPGLKYRENLTR